MSNNEILIFLKFAGLRYQFVANGGERCRTRTLTEHKQNMIYLTTTVTLSFNTYDDSEKKLFVLHRDE